VEPTVDLTELDRLALACDGATLGSGWAALDPATLTGPKASASVRLLAHWEAERRFTAYPTNNTLDPAAVTSFVAALTTELGQPPPTWWVEQLASGKHDGPDPDHGLSFYDVGMTANGDRRGDLVPGPGTTRIRPGVSSVLSESSGQLHFDLSVGRLELGPLPTDPGVAIEVGRAHAGSTIYYATFSPGAGGFRFPLRAVNYRTGPFWQAEVCGPDRQVLGGLGYLTVEIVVLEPEVGGKPGELRASSGATGVAVFTAESHGIALDVFDPATGDRTLAWSSDFWFARRLGPELLP